MIPGPACPVTAVTTGPSPSAAPSVPGPVRRWVLGARPRTLPAAIVPVVVGTAAAHPLQSAAGLPGHSWWYALGALVVALAIQVGTNYANDYSDGIRGTDDARVGPVRLVAAGLASATAVKRAALIAFGVAGGGRDWRWPGPPRGGSCWWGPPAWPPDGSTPADRRPYGYAGLGELFVFVFFGLVATVGTYYVQTLSLDRWPVWLAAALVGLLATALLLANNLRDIGTDARAANGRSPSGSAAAPADGSMRPASPSRSSSCWPGVSGRWPPRHPCTRRRPSSPSWPLPWPWPRSDWSEATPPAVNCCRCSAATGRLQLAFGVLLAVSLWLWVS